MSTAAMYVILFLGCFVVASAAREDKIRLINDLMTSYNKLGHPEGDNGTALRVEHSISINRIVSLDNGVLTTDAWVSLQWTDTSLQWDPKEYGDVRKITLPSRLLWQPDIVLYNSAAEYTGFPSGDINMVIQNDGHVFFIPPVKIMSYCNINDNFRGITICTMKFGSWTQDIDSIDLQFRYGEENGSIDLSNFDGSFNKDWALDSVSAKRNVHTYACCPDSYVDLVYTLKLK